jgi:O-methyltransferase involved in polyketide biosynthesis
VAGEGRSTEKSNRIAGQAPGRHERESAPAGIDIDKPSPARIYDVFLGGKDNYEVDRAAAKVAVQNGPDIPRAARENRAFLARAIRFAVEAGITQFIDLGTGLPTQGNVHEVAQSMVSDAHVVYTDNDPIVLAHARALLPPSKTTTVIQADVREPETILDHPSTRALIDFTRPVGIIMLAVLHFATDEQARNTIEMFREAVVPGSHLILSHSTVEGHPGSQAVDAWKNATSRLRSRTRAEIEELFQGFELVDPGVVWVPQWRPHTGRGEGTRWMYAGVGRRI